MAEVTQSTEQKANYNWIQDWSASHAQRKRQKALSDKRKRANDILAEKEYAKSASEAQYAYDNARNNASNNRRLAEAEAAKLAYTDPAASKQMYLNAKVEYDNALKTAKTSYDDSIRQAKEIRKTKDYTDDASMNLGEGTDDTQREAAWDKVISDNEAEKNKPEEKDNSKKLQSGQPKQSNTKGSKQAGLTEEKKREFYDSFVTPMMTGVMSKAFNKNVDPSSAQVHLRNQAEMHDKQAGNEQKNAQQNFQIANRNYRVEAEKNAASQAAAENAQTVNNLGNVSAGAAALQRGVKAADYNTQMQRQDQQRAEGVKNQREMWGSKQTAEEERANADKDAHDYAENQVYNNMSNYLSMGGNSSGNAQPKPTEPPAEQPPTEEPKPAEEPKDTEEIKGSPQAVLNYITYAHDPELAAKYKLTGDDLELYKEWGSPEPLTEEEYANNGEEQAVANTPRLSDFWQKYSDVNPGNRFIDNKQYNAGENGVTSEGINSTTTDIKRTGSMTPSDSSIKNIISALSSIKY